MDSTRSVLAALMSRPHDPEELLLAARMLHGGPPPTDLEGLREFLEFFVVEWVDAAGWTTLERAVDERALDAGALRLGRETRVAMWVVDGWEGDVVLLRDLATEDEIAVHAPGAAKDLPTRTVLRARVLPEVTAPDCYVFGGSPDLYDGLGVIARMDLLRAWHETPAPDLHARLSALRAAFTQQREEQAAFVAFFGADERVFRDADDLSADLARFVNFLGNDWRFPSLGGRTRAEAHRSRKGDEPKVVQIQLGESLRGEGRPGIVYDRVHGVHFLPRYGELVDHLSGVARHPDVLEFYVDEPGLPEFLLRDGPPELAAAKRARSPSPARAVPSVFPGFEEEAP